MRSILILEFVWVASDQKISAAWFGVCSGSTAHANTGIINANLALTIHSTCAMSCPARCPDQASTRNAASALSVHLPILRCMLVHRSALYYRVDRCHGAICSLDFTRREYLRDARRDIARYSVNRPSKSRFFVIEFLSWFIDRIEVATIGMNGGSA